MQTTAKRWLALTGFVASTLLIIVLSSGAFAADKGVVKADPNGLADLEERIAELEATVAKKGNRKVSLEVSGVINKALVWYDAGSGASDWNVGDNSNSPSYLQFKAVTTITSSWKAGGVVQINFGDYEFAGTGGYGHLGGGTDGISVRQSYLFIQGSVGKFSLGKLSQATDEITQINTSNAGVVSTPLSLRPLVGANGIGEALDIFDGGRANAVRYDITRWGFTLSASAAQADIDSGGNTDGTIWDVALRYEGEAQGFQVKAGVGYRDGLAIEQTDFGFMKFGANIADIQVASGSASVMHVPTGIFVTGAAGQVDVTDYFAGADKVRGYAVQGGLEERWNPLGKTTVYGEWGRWEFGNLLGDLKPEYMGLGVVQAIDQAAMEVYLTGRRYETDGLLADDVDVVTAGARVRF